MSRDSFSYTHGDTGTKPGSALNFQSGGRPSADYFDWYWYNVTEAISGHAAEFNRLDSDDDGVVDAADGAATWSNGGTTQATHPTDVNFGSNVTLSADGDGTVTVSADIYTDAEAVSAVNAETSLSVNISGDADSVDGYHGSDFALSGHLHDGRYYQPDGSHVFITETRTTDPSTPSDGRMWVRTDL